MAVYVQGAVAAAPARPAAAAFQALSLWSRARAAICVGVSIKAGSCCSAGNGASSSSGTSSAMENWPIGGNVG
eukprot:1381187-Amphidinium_carterae.1